MLSYIDYVKQSLKGSSTDSEELVEEEDELNEPSDLKKKIFMDDEVMLTNIYDVIKFFNFGKDDHPIFDNPNYHVLIYSEIKTILKHLTDLKFEATLSSDYQYIIRWFYTQKFYDAALNDETFLDPLVPKSKNKNFGLYKYLLNYLSIGDVEKIENYLIDSCQSIYVKIDEFIRSSPRKNENNVVFSNNKREATYMLTCGNTSFIISHKYHRKLSSVYLDGARQNINLFNIRVFNLLCRYNTLYAPGYQAMLPEQVFNSLRGGLRVKHEVFASPLNSNLDRYTSAYPDTDYYFGSSGNFFKSFTTLFKNGGSFELNPPFLEEHMLLMTLIVLHTLSICQYELSFTIIIPSWTDSLTFRLLFESAHNVLPDKEIRLERLQHYYRNGGNYESTDESTKSASNNSSIFILQNELGKVKYKVTPEILEELITGFST